MDSIAETLRLLKRQTQLERRCRQTGRVSTLDERELFTIRARLEQFPAAIAAVAELASAKQKSLDEIRIEDIEQWDDRRARGP